MNDGLLSPQFNIWLAHGGDHFTVLFTFEKDISCKEFLLYHWNGLKPGGIRILFKKIILNYKE
jgi:hypothetical protein